jgi:hypothetical protein
MSKIATYITLLCTALVCSLPAAPAQAQSLRTFVSAAGSDSNNCTDVSTPCRHFFQAYAATSPGGEIDVLDPGNYGGLIISQAISIEGFGWALAATGSGAAVIINAGPSDRINIRGVVLDGFGFANNTGIQFNTGGSLNVQDSVIRNFGFDGIKFSPSASSRLSVSNSLISGNGEAGILISLPSGSGAVVGVVDHVVMEDNSFAGLYLNPQAGSTQTVNLTISDSVSANNGRGVAAISGDGETVNVIVRNSTIANNSVVGLLDSGGGVTLWVTRSTITGNSIGWETGSGATFLSYNDNVEVGNTNDNGAMPLIGYK